MTNVLCLMPQVEQAFLGADLNFHIERRKRSVGQSQRKWGVKELNDERERVVDLALFFFIR